MNPILLLSLLICYIKETPLKLNDTLATSLNLTKNQCHEALSQISTIYDPYSEATNQTSLNASIVEFFKQMTAPGVLPRRFNSTSLCRIFDNANVRCPFVAEEKNKKNDGDSSSPVPERLIKLFKNATSYEQELYNEVVHLKNKYKLQPINHIDLIAASWYDYQAEVFQNITSIGLLFQAEINASQAVLKHSMQTLQTAYHSDDQPFIRFAKSMFNTSVYNEVKNITIAHNNFTATVKNITSKMRAVEKDAVDQIRANLTSPCVPRGTSRTIGRESIIKINQTIKPNFTLYSPNRYYRLHYQSDGNLVLYSLYGGKKDVIWSADSHCAIVEGNHYNMTKTGHLAYYAKGMNRPSWMTHPEIPAVKGGSVVPSHYVLTNGGGLVLCSLNGTAIHYHTSAFGMGMNPENVPQDF